MTTLSARAEGRRTKSANGRNRETWSGYRAAGSKRRGATRLVDGAFKRVMPFPF
jgi:hypothetical protein